MSTQDQSVVDAFDGVNLPRSIDDVEAAAIIWPMLQDGVPRETLVGRLVVGLGIDSTNALRRVDGLLGSLAEADLLVVAPRRRG